jgi:hypothetical protein
MLTDSSSGAATQDVPAELEEAPGMFAGLTKQQKRNLKSAIHRKKKAALKRKVAI